MEGICESVPGVKFLLFWVGSGDDHPEELFNVFDGDEVGWGLGLSEVEYKRDIAPSFVLK